LNVKTPRRAEVMIFLENIYEYLNKMTRIINVEYYYKSMIYAQID